MRCKVSFVVPVYNNSNTLTPLAQAICKVAGEAFSEFEIIFVNDGSTDSSEATILELKAGNANIQYLTLDANYGQSMALIAGLQQAQHEISVSLDADLQDPPAAVPQLVNELVSTEADIVFGGRVGKYESKKRHLTAGVFKKTFSALTSGRVPASAGLFFAIHTAQAKQFSKYAGSRPYLLALVNYCKMHCVSIPVERNRRPGGGSGYNFYKRWKTGIGGVLSLYTISQRSMHAGWVATKNRDGD